MIIIENRTSQITARDPGRKCIWHTCSSALLIDNGDPGESEEVLGNVMKTIEGTKRWYHQRRVRTLQLEGLGSVERMNGTLAWAVVKLPVFVILNNTEKNTRSLGSPDTQHTPWPGFRMFGTVQVCHCCERGGDQQEQENNSKVHQKSFKGRHTT